MALARVASAVVAAFCLGWGVPAAAQGPVDPSGHWEGTLQVPDRGELKFEIDLARNEKGVLAGTFSSPSQRIKGLPLAKVSVEGATLTFFVDRPDQPFTATMAADGKSMSGQVTTDGRSVPFTLARTGEARIAPAPRSAPIPKELEGTWNGMLTADGREMRIVLKLSNQSDGTSTGTIANLDQSAVEIPVTNIAQKENAVTFDVDAVGGSYAGSLNAERTELTGTWTQAALTAPITFRRAAAAGK